MTRKWLILAAILALLAVGVIGCSTAAEAATEEETTSSIVTPIALKPTFTPLPTATATTAVAELAEPTASADTEADSVTPYPAPEMASAPGSESAALANQASSPDEAYPAPPEQGERSEPPEPPSDPVVDESSLLLLGLLELAETDEPITEEQATAMLPLVEAALAADAEEELQLTLEAIQELLSAEQFQAISAMSLTQDDVMAWIQEQAPAERPEPGGERPQDESGELAYPAPDGKGAPPQQQGEMMERRPSAGGTPSRVLLQSLVAELEAIATSA